MDLKCLKQRFLTYYKSEKEGCQLNDDFLLAIGKKLSKLTKNTR